MTGDLDMQTNFIHSTAIPNDDSDLVNKKYVDDADATKLNLSTGNMSGDVNMRNHKLTNLKDPVDSKDSMHKKYVDDQDAKKLSLTGGRMTGDLDMGNHHIIHAANYSPSFDHHVVNKKYVTNLFLPNTISNLYLLQMDDQGIFDATRDDVDYIEYTGSNKKVEKLLNLSRKKDWNLSQTDSNKQPLFVKSSINNKFYCLQYLGSNRNNLHLNTFQDILSNQHLNFYFVYGLKSLNSSSNETSLFKITSNKTTSHPLPFDFGVSYRNSLLYLTNSSRNSISNSNWELKANATQIRKLICLSIHWDQNNVRGVKKGNLYVNGKELVSFTTNQKLSHSVNTKLYLGSKNKDYGKIDGEIFYVFISTRKMKEKEIGLNHYLLCKKFEIDFDEEEVIKSL